MLGGYRHCRLHRIVEIKNVFTNSRVREGPGLKEGKDYIRLEMGGLNILGYVVNALVYQRVYWR